MTLNHIGTNAIETERLILRRFEITDAEDMYNNWANDDEVSKYLPWKTHQNVDETITVVQYWIKEYENQRSYQWAIVPKNYGHVIGSITLHGIEDRSKKCETGYCIGKKYWNQGIMTEALKAIINYGFCKVGVNRMQAVHHVANAASGMVMEKCGMKHEGVLRQYGLDNKGDLIDKSIWAILRED